MVKSGPNETSTNLKRIATIVNVVVLVPADLDIVPLGGGRITVCGDVPLVLAVVGALGAEREVRLVKQPASLLDNHKRDNTTVTTQT
jgi:hypothetical protein